MLRTTYADPIVAGLIKRQFVPIWVDADRRPDINERYNLGGWPTTAFLTPEGQLLGGETYVGPERMAPLLRQVADAFVVRRDDIRAAVDRLSDQQPASSVAEIQKPDSDFDAWLVHHLLDQFDTEHGGFGITTKRLQAPALRFALAACQDGNTTLHNVVVKTLDAIGWGGLHDDVDGGIFRYCAARDWTEPSLEKLLGVNADALRLFLESGVLLGELRYRDKAIDIIQYVRNTLIDHSEGGFFASQHADAHYYAADAVSRVLLTPPKIDRSIYADETARMVTAFVRAADILEDSSLLEFAVTSLERVLVDAYQRGNGIAHQIDSNESIRGLLIDHVAVSDALLNLYQVTEREVYLDLAQELMRFSLRSLWDVNHGGFVDRVSQEDDVGLLQQPVRPFGLNCAAAQVLARLARHTKQDEFQDRAVATLISQTPGVRTHGVDAAPYALAMQELKL